MNASGNSVRRAGNPACPTIRWKMLPLQTCDRQDCLSDRLSRRTSGEEGQGARPRDVEPAITSRASVEQTGSRSDGSPEKTTAYQEYRPPSGNFRRNSSRS